MEGTSDEKPFFIEATLGERRDVSHPGYLGIESLWNNNSYYVNLQERLQVGPSLCASETCVSGKYAE